jgi:hypothetical protein
MRRRQRTAIAALLVPAACLLLCGAISAAAQAPVLGNRSFAAPYGDGFGEPHPREIYNGGVPSGLIESISWRDWGAPVSFGHGLGHQYRPHGGYYRHPVQVRLRAEKLGTCPGSRRPAYTRLKAKFQKKPGGAFGPWFSWSGADSICEPPFGR